MRSVLLDSRVQPIENIVLNPKFARALPGTTIVRRNLCINPRLTSNQNGWGLYSSNSSSVTSGVRRTAVSWMGEVLNTFRASVTNAISTSLFVIFGNAGMMPVRADAVYTASIDAVFSFDVSATIKVEWYSASNAYLSASVGANVQAKANVPQRMSIANVRAPGGATWCKIVVGNNTANLAGGDFVEATRAMIEERPSLLPFFDAETPNTLGISYGYEGTAGTSAAVAKALVSEIRRNFLRNPSFEATSVSPWAARGQGTVTLSRVTTDSHHGQAAAQVVTDGTYTAQGIMQQYIQGTQAFATGTFSASIWLKAPAGTLLNLSLTNNTNAVGSVDFTATGAWQKVSTSVVAAAGTISLLVITKAAVAITMLFDEGLIEYSKVVGTYFDGYTTPDADLTPMWDGTEYTSPAVLYGVVPSKSPVANAARYISRRNNEWYVAVYPNSQSSDDSFLGGETITSGLFAGRTYTFLTRASFDVLPAKGAPAINVFYRTPSAGYVSTKFPAPSTPGTHILRGTVKMPADATEVFVRLQHGTGQGAPIVYFTDLLIVEGEYTGPFFSGDTPGCLWRGVTHDSTSVGYPSVISA